MFQMSAEGFDSLTSFSDIVRQTVPQARSCRTEGSVTDGRVRAYDVTQLGPCCIETITTILCQKNKMLLRLIIVTVCGVYTAAVMQPRMYRSLSLKLTCSANLFNHRLLVPTVLPAVDEATS